MSVLALRGNVTSTPGLKSIVIDPKTHTAWTAYSKGNQSFVQPFTPDK
jgi:hypothetical protein